MKVIFFLIIFVLFSDSKHILKKLTSLKSINKGVSCPQPFVLINWGYNMPLYLTNIVRDSNGIASYADVALDQTLSTHQQWCYLNDQRIQHIETGLYLDIHGPGEVCWAQDSCEWATQVDAYGSEGTSWTWTNAIVNNGYHMLEAMGRTLTGYNQGYVNMGVISSGVNAYQLWIFH